MATFQLDASLPFAAALNPGFAQAAFQRFDSIYREMLVALGGGPTEGPNTGYITDTNILWNASTEVQSLIAERWASGEQVPGKTLQEILTDNVGPDLPWNWSPEDWGLVQGIAGKVTLVLVMDQKTGTVTRQIAVPAQ